MADTTTFRVGMSCAGCSNAVKRILGKIEGVTEVDADLATKLVVVKGGADKKAEMEAALKKWAASAEKEVTLIS